MTPPAAPERYKNHRFLGDSIHHGPSGASGGKFTVSSNSCVLKWSEGWETRGQRLRNLGQGPTPCEPSPVTAYDGLVVPHRRASGHLREAIAAPPYRKKSSNCSWRAMSASTT